jgi:glucose/arabinose dehydrogenase
MRALVILLLISIGVVHPVSAQSAADIGLDVPRCTQRLAYTPTPHQEWVLWCPELPVNAPELGALGFTAIAFDADGTLYGVHPYGDALYYMDDTNDDLLPDSPRLLRDGLRRPSALHHADGVLYIAGAGTLYAYTIADGRLRVLRDDLPAAQFMVHGLWVQGDRLYIGVPMPCDDCAPRHPWHGTVLSMSLAGADVRVVARGLRYPAALAYYEDALWVSDIAPDALYRQAMMDEINRIDLTQARVPHFGFPYCVGADNRPHQRGDFDCTTATAPALPLQTHSYPLDIEPYPSTAFMYVHEDVFITLGGSPNSAEVRGYGVVTLETLSDERIIGEPIFPMDRNVGGHPRITFDRRSGIRVGHLTIVNERGVGIYPRRIYDVAVDPRGWIFFSVAGGRIYSFRHGDHDVCDFITCDWLEDSTEGQDQ